MARKRRFHPDSAKAEPGNLLAIKSGAQSEQLLAPARERLLVGVQEQYPELSDAEQRMLADRLARIELASAFIDQNGLFRNRKRGEPWPIVDRLEKWTNRAENLLRLARIERRQHSPIDVAVALAELNREAGDD